MAATVRKETAVVHGGRAEEGWDLPMAEGIIFDMDGLMFDSERIWATLWESALGRFGLEELPGLAEASRGTTGEAARAVLRRFYGDQVDAEGIRCELERLAALRFAAGAPKKPGLDRLLAYGEKHGLPMAVASSSHIEVIEANLRAGNVERYFAHVVSGDAVERSKPAPDIFLEAARRLGVRPAGTLVLEDSFAGVRAGAAGGFATVMVPDMMQPTDEVRGLCTACCTSLNEVCDLLEQGVL